MSMSECFENAFTLILIVISYFLTIAIIISGIVIAGFFFLAFTLVSIPITFTIKMFDITSEFLVPFDKWWRNKFKW